MTARLTLLVDKQVLHSLLLDRPESLIADLQTDGCLELVY